MVDDNTPPKEEHMAPECFGYFGDYERVQGDCDTCDCRQGCFERTEADANASSAAAEAAEQNKGDW